MIILLVSLLPLRLVIECSSFYWDSGIIEKECIDNIIDTGASSASTTTSTTSALVGIVKYLTLFSVDNQDNFVSIRLPLRSKPRLLQKVLFVSPRIGQEAPEAVKDTFLRFSCTVLGLLLRDCEISRIMRGGGIFHFNSTPIDRFVDCMREFERKFQLNLEAVMIDSRPDNLSFSLLQLFADKGIELFRHPAHFFEEEVFYHQSPQSPIERKRITSNTEYPWCPEARIQMIFNQIYYRVMNTQPYELAHHHHHHHCSSQPAAPKDKDKDKEDVQQEESIHGPLSEIDLNESKLVPSTNTKEKVLLFTDEDYEFISS